mmetsp:Transcript_157975/g.506688  ORF Transcript_157975/g.506688 Transcript_157975/m.506688 type:complete len:211 (-) Transcript_157975:2992-3624(-)
MSAVIVGDLGGNNQQASNQEHAIQEWLALVDCRALRTARSGGQNMDSKGKHEAHNLALTVGTIFEKTRSASCAATRSGLSLATGCLPRCRPLQDAFRPRLPRPKGRTLVMRWASTSSWMTFSGGPVDRGREEERSLRTRCVAKAPSGPSRRTPALCRSEPGCRRRSAAPCGCRGAAPPPSRAYGRWRGPCGDRRVRRDQAWSGTAPLPNS